MKNKINWIVTVATILALIIAVTSIILSFNKRFANDAELQTINNTIIELRSKIDSSTVKQREVLDKMTYEQLITLENKHDKYVNEIKAQNNRIEILAWAFGSITLVGLLTGLSSFLVQLFGG